jgi:plasmid stabilization system protein ParE
VNIIWTVGAKADREEMLDKMVAERPAMAAEFNQTISSTIAKIASFPRMGKVGTAPETREFVAHKNYRVIYRIDGSSIVVMGIAHTSKRWLPIFPR